MTPDGTATLSVGTQWIADLLTGSVGSAVAILAIAGVGFALLQGHLAVRDGVRAVLGCFIVFGAPVIAQGLADLAARSAAGSSDVYSAAPPPPIAIPDPPQPDHDPYAGASLQM